jgi:uncharacterized protein YbaR (Trm112 family)
LTLAGGFSRFGGRGWLIRRPEPGSLHTGFKEGAMLDPKLLEILACPQCKQPVVPLPDHSALDCPRCKLRYRVEKDIPIMLVDEAEAIPGGE